jgi:hypothetical protein
MQTLEAFSQFREALYPTCARRAAALLELVDAGAQTPRPHSPAELSLDCGAKSSWPLFCPFVAVD